MFLSVFINHYSICLLVFYFLPLSYLFFYSLFHTYSPLSFFVFSLSILFLIRLSFYIFFSLRFFFAACARLSWRCEIEVLPWRRALEMAQRGEVEGIFTVVDSPERRQYFHVSPPVIEGRYMLFARQGNGLQFKGDAQVLAGRVIGAYGPSVTALTLAQLIEAVPRARSEVEPDNRTVLRKLSAGRYGEDGLALVNEAVAEVLMREDGIRNLQPAGVVKAFGYAFGLSRQTVDPAQSLALARRFAVVGVPLEKCP